MLSLQRLAKLGYVLILATALVLLLSNVKPVQAQRSIAYFFLPGSGAQIAGRAALSGAASPLTSETNAIQVLTQAGIPANPFMVGGAGLGGAAGVGGGVGGGGLGGGGFAGGGNRGGAGGMGGLGGFGGGMAGAGGMGLGGGLAGGGIGGMGGFAGKGFGGFNGKKAL